MGEHYDVIVIGGGASGLAATVSAAEQGCDVLLIEKSDRLGRKILASGNGRCNLLNSGEPKYYGQPDFALRVLSHYPFSLIASSFYRYGLPITEESDGRCYPATFQSSSLIALFKNALEINHVKAVLLSPVMSVRREKERFLLSVRNHQEYSCRNLIVACGGASQPRLGGTSDGYRLLQFFGHRIIPVFPSLVPLNTDPQSISGLSGIRCRCALTLMDKDLILHREKGEILFTDYGVSGICVMQCARFIREHQTDLIVNFMADFFSNRTDLITELKRRQELFGGLSPVALLEGIVVSKLAYAILKQAGIAMRGETSADLSENDLHHIADTAFAYRIHVTDTRGFDYAQVTAGGADCREFDPDTMSSRIVPGLYATGELLNVDGDCGGYNLMFAFSSGILAGTHAGQACR